MQARDKVHLSGEGREEEANTGEAGTTGLGPFRVWETREEGRV